MIHLIHGIHPSQKGGTVAKLVPYLMQRGYKIMVHEYGLALAITARFLNGRRAKKIGKSVKYGDIIVGHSNGCAIAHLIQQERFVSGIIMINPALEEDAEFNKVNWVHVYHNKGDNAVHWSELLVAHPWGEMGRTGYIGFDSRVVNFDGKAIKTLPRLDGHSAFFDEANIGPWSSFMMDRMEDAYTSRPSG